MIDTKEPNSPGWWFKRLLEELGTRQARLNMLDRYYHGLPNLPEGAEGCADAYLKFQKKARSNFAELIVEAVRERMVPVGFRTGAAGDELGDKEAWRIWQANNMDTESVRLNRTMLSLSDAYTITGFPDKETGVPLITVEDPRQVITAEDPARRGRTIAALKVFADDIRGVDRAFLYMGGIVYYATKRKGSGFKTWTINGWDWENQPGTDQPWARLPCPRTPVVRFPNRLGLDGRPLAEFESVIDLLDRICHMVLQRLVIATTQAFKQRALKGDLPVNDPSGNPIDYNGLFRASPGALWQLPADVDIWESGQADMAGILAATRHDVQDVAALTRTPLFYLTPDAANGSAEGASLAREGLTFKAEDRITETSDPYEQMMTLAFLFAGDEERAQRQDMEVLWAPVERQSLAERADAAVKAQAVGVPWRTVMTDIMGYSPQQVDRMEKERATDTFLAAAAQPITAAPPLADAVAS